MWRYCGYIFKTKYIIYEKLYKVRYFSFKTIRCEEELSEDIEETILSKDLSLGHGYVNWKKKWHKSSEFQFYLGDLTEDNSRETAFQPWGIALKKWGRS